MKQIRNCPVFLILAVSGLIFTLVGMGGRNSLYKDYELNYIKTPFLALMMEGISEGVYPWDALDVGEAVGAVSDSLNLPLSGEEPLLTENIVGEADLAGQQEEADTPAHIEGDAVVIAEEKEEKTYNYETVTEDYFDDAVFIGDSRTVGLFEYGGMEERADFFAKISLTIYDVFTEPIVKDEETDKMITVEEALQKKQYGKVYLMLGINELGTGTTESFMEVYREVVAGLQKLQPDAVIYVEGIMRVTGSKNEADPIFNNTNINDKNNEIEKLADNKNIFYIDVNEVVCDEQGNLNTEYTIDEIHLKAQYYGIWKQFLLERGIVR